MTIVYGTKAFPNVALMRILAEEGIGADVSTLGELRFAQAAGIAGADLVVHGNNKSLRRARGRRPGGRTRRLDSLEEVDRAREAGVSRTLIRVTPGIEADTHEAIRTGHHGSKFGLTPEDSLEALRRAPETEGLHVHIGSQLQDLAAARTAVDWIAAFAARAKGVRLELRTLDLGGGSASRRPRGARGRDRRVHRGLIAELGRAASRKASRCRA